jgi:hypothetical protein
MVAGGRTHNGLAPAPVPSLFGMNFQAVSVGEKLIEKSVNLTGGYLDAQGTPTPALLSEIQFVDASIGMMIGGVIGECIPATETTRKRIRRGVFKSVDELKKQAIIDYLNKHNDQPNPCVRDNSSSAGNVVTSPLDVIGV